MNTRGSAEAIVGFRVFNAAARIQHAAALVLDTRGVVRKPREREVGV